MDNFIDVSGAPLVIGDKVATQYQQLFRIGRIEGFTKQKVIVVFDFSAQGTETPTSMERAKIAPWKIAKVANQDCTLQTYFNVSNMYNS